MKKIFALALGLMTLAMMLVGCGSKEIDNKSEKTSEEVKEVTTSAVPAGFTDGYELADYEKFNSYAEENHLGGTKIYDYITFDKIESINDEAEGFDIFFGIGKNRENKEWLIALNASVIVDKSQLDRIIGHPTVICGEYSGYSDVYNLPSYNATELFDLQTGERIKCIMSYTNMGDESGESTNAPTQAPTETPTETPTEAPTETPTEAPKPSMTLGQQQALKSAKSYLDYSAFSYSGLVGQLEYEGFSHEEAEFAAKKCGADWNEQALKCAKSYLEYSSFSRDGLIDQLEYEGFTNKQAVNAAKKCGANWNEQAAKMAKSYLEYSSFSRDGLIDQLEFEGFTHEQAVYGAKSVGY